MFFRTKKTTSDTPKEPTLSGGNTANTKPQDYLKFGAGVCFSRIDTTAKPAPSQPTSDSKEFQFRPIMNGGFGN